MRSILVGTTIALATLLGTVSATPASSKSASKSSPKQASKASSKSASKSSDGKYPCVDGEVGLGSSQMCDALTYDEDNSDNDACQGTFPAIFNNGGKDTPAMFIGDPDDYCNPKWQNGWATKCNGNTPTEVTGPGVKYDNCVKKPAGFMITIGVAWTDNHIDWCCKSAAPSATGRVLTKASSVPGPQTPKAPSKTSAAKSKAGKEKTSTSKSTGVKKEKVGSKAGA